METLLSPMSLRSSSSQPAASKSTSGATVTVPSAAIARLRRTAYQRLFSPPTKRWSCRISPELSQSLFHIVGPLAVAASSAHSSRGWGPSIAMTR